MTRIDELHRGWMSDRTYEAEYEAFEKEFEVAAATIRIRTEVGLDKSNRPRRMGTKRERGGSS